MNIILHKERDTLIEAGTATYYHIVSILKLKEGDSFKSGSVNGCLGESYIKKVTESAIHYTFTPDSRIPPPLSDTTLLIGTPRPPVALRLIKDLTTIGVGNILFFSADLSEKSYLSSKIWREESLEEALILGAQQGGTTYLPKVEKYTSLSLALRSLPSCQLLIFNNGEATGLEEIETERETPITAVIGPERGLTERELNYLLEKGGKKVSLGERILRAETASLIVSHFLVRKRQRWGQKSEQYSAQ